MHVGATAKHDQPDPVAVPVRYEAVDTQKEVPSGFSSNPSNDVTIWTLGLAWQPIDNLIFKLDYQDWDNDANDAVDRLNFGFGYVF